MSFFFFFSFSCLEDVPTNVSHLVVADFLVN